MTPSFRTLFLASLLPCVAAPATAATINFDSQAVGAPDQFTNTLNSPLVIGNATFTGGQLLTNENGSADATGVYGTDGYGTGYIDQITISFATGVTGVTLLATNNTPGTIYVSDNVGDYFSQQLGYDGASTFTLNGTGITYVTVSEGADAPYLFDFAIDDVGFNNARGNIGSSATPEPSSVALLLTGLGGAAGMARRRRVQ